MKTKSSSPVPRSLNRFPEDWDEARVRKLLDYYENQTEEEAIAEAEAAFESSSDTVSVTAPPPGHKCPG